jgi:hypothetical protein
MCAIGSTPSSTSLVSGMGPYIYETNRHGWIFLYRCAVVSTAPPIRVRAMADHDHSYKLLFSHPEMVRDLLEGFVQSDWVAGLDFSSLERVSGAYVSDDLQGRASDIVWRVRSGDRYVYIAIEFQSTVEQGMALRVLAYVVLLYQELLRDEKVTLDEGLATVVPIVLYNGENRWSAPTVFESLLFE